MPSATPPQFTEKERAFLRLLQGDLPDTATPFAHMAAEAGLSEEEGLALARRLKEEGVIRRFGASIRHQRAGFAHNVMVAWQVGPEEADRAGRLMAAHPLVSHCYYRPSRMPDWPYELYAMIHGRHAGETAETVAALARETGLTSYTALESLDEMKKTSMNYF